MGRLSSEVIAYFKSFPLLLDDSNRDEDLSLVIENLYKEIEGREVSLSLHTETSRVIEKVLLRSSPSQVRVFFENLAERCGSHVIEALLKRIEILWQSAATTDDQSIKGLGILVGNFCSEIKSNISSLIIQKFATHVLRLLFRLTQTGPPSDLNTFNTDCMAALCKSKKDAQRMLLDPSSSLCLQALLEFTPTSLERTNFLNVLFNCSVVSVTGKTESSFDSEGGCEDWISKLLKSRTGSRAFEACIKMFDEQYIDWVFERVVMPNLQEMILGEFSQFPVKSIILSLKNSHCLKKLLKDKECIFSSLLVKNERWDILRALIAACSKLSKTKLTEKRDSFLMKCFGSVDAKSGKTTSQVIEYILNACLDAMSSSSKGSGQIFVLLNELLTMPSNEKFLESFLNAITPEALLRMSCNRQASFVIESVFKSPSILVTFKNGLSERMLHKYFPLACDKFGSHVLETIWQAVDWSVKAKIASELQSNLTGLKDNFYGKFVLSKCHIAQFDCSAMTKKTVIPMVENKKEKTRKALQSILLDEEVPMKKQKNR